jgi:hypothetical protein
MGDPTRSKAGQCKLKLEKKNIFPSSFRQILFDMKGGLRRRELCRFESSMDPMTIESDKQGDLTT